MTHEALVILAVLSVLAQALCSAWLFGAIERRNQRVMKVATEVLENMRSEFVVHLRHIQMVFDTEHQSSERQRDHLMAIFSKAHENMVRLFLEQHRDTCHLHNETYHRLEKALGNATLPTLAAKTPGTVEIIMSDGTHLYRPLGHPDIQEAARCGAKVHYPEEAL